MILGGAGSANQLSLPCLEVTHLDQLVYSFHVFTLGDIEADFRTPSPPYDFQLKYSIIKTYS